MKVFIKNNLLKLFYAINLLFNPNYKINYNNKGVINFIDVGSVNGLPYPWKNNAGKIKFILNFEPNAQPIYKKNCITLNKALWEYSTNKPFYKYAGFDGSGSSLFRQNYKYVEDNWDKLKNRGPKYLAETWFNRSMLVKTLNIKCMDLDTVISRELSNTNFHFLKIDAQGAELNILKGSKKLLSTTLIGIHCELFLEPLYEDIGLLNDVENFLLGFGFELIKKFPPHGTFNSQQDCLFLNKSRNFNKLNLIKNIYNL